MTATYQSGSYQGIVDAFSAVQAAQGEKRYYEPNYRGIIEAVSDLKKWGQADGGTTPPGWQPEYDSNGNVIGGIWDPAPENGTLWFDENQGRLFVWVDDDFYQANGGDGLPHVGENPPNLEIPGALWFNTNTNVLYIYDGSGWTIVSTSSGISTATLALSNPTTEAFSGISDTLPDPVVSTQEDYNLWLVEALKALEAGLESNQSAEPLDMGTSLPESGTDGDFFYKTNNNTLYVWNDGSWHKAVPNPNLNNQQVIIDMKAVDTALEAEIDALQVDVAAAQGDITALQGQPHHTYTIGTSTATGQGDGFTPGIYMVDEGGTATGLTVTGVGAIAVADGANGITIAAASIESTLSTIQADYLTSLDKTELQTSIETNEASITAVEDTQASLLNTLSTVSATVDDLPSLAEVQSRLSLAGGALTGQLDMAGNRLRNLPTPTSGSEPTTKSYVDAVDTDIRSNHIKRTDGILESVLVNNSHSDKAALDFSGSSFYAQDAFKFKTNSPGTDNYVSFGTSANPWEYSWTFDSDEAFNWIHDDERVFAIQGKNAYAKDLVLCNLTANADGPLYTNAISVRTKLADLETVTTALTTQINELDLDSNTKNIYYSDNAPTANLEDGDIWFDSHNLRLNVRHGNAWVFPDRVEDVALKTALLDAVNTSTDYTSLKANLISALN